MTPNRRLAWPAYLVSLAMIAMPLADAATSVYPWHLGEARWRFGAVGLFSSASLIPTVGVFVAYVTASLLEHHRTKRVIGIVALLVATLAVLAVISFSLDALQTRAAVRPEMRLSFNVASITAALKTCLSASCALAVGLSALRDKRVLTSAPDMPLIVAQKG